MTRPVRISVFDGLLAALGPVASNQPSGQAQAAPQAAAPPTPVASDVSIPQAVFPDAASLEAALDDAMSVSPTLPAAPASDPASADTALPNPVIDDAVVLPPPQNGNIASVQPRAGRNEKTGPQIRRRTRDTTDDSLVAALTMMMLPQLPPTGDVPARSHQSSGGRCVDRKCRRDGHTQSIARDRSERRPAKPSAGCRRRQPPCSLHGTACQRRNRRDTSPGGCALRSVANRQRRRSAIAREGHPFTGSRETDGHFRCWLGKDRRKKHDVRGGPTDRQYRPDARQRRLIDYRPNGHRAIPITAAKQLHDRRKTSRYSDPAARQFGRPSRVKRFMRPRRRPTTPRSNSRASRR